MGKTVRENRWHRSPKGKKNALINSARKGAVPPDGWDDLNTSRKNVYATIAHQCILKGLGAKETAQKLVSRAKKSHQVLCYNKALEIVESAIDHVEFEERFSKRVRGSIKSLNEQWREQEVEARKKIVDHLKTQKLLPKDFWKYRDWALKHALEIFGNKYSANRFMLKEVMPILNAAHEAAFGGGE